MQTKSKTHSRKANRILSVTVKRMCDESPDTSWLGEYSDHATSDFSIDRAHAEDCASIVPVNPEGIRILISARAFVAETQSRLPDAESQDWQDLEDAYYLLDSLTETPECDCGGHGDMECNQYRYFNPSFNYVDKNGKATDTPENVRKYTRQDYERMERLNAGDWCFIGIRAYATISLPQTPDEIQHSGWLRQEITSGGLWGIESDSDAPYLASVEADELSDLKTQLLALGFSKRAIATAFKTVERKES